MDIRLIRLRLRQFLAGWVLIASATGSTAADLGIEFLAETTIPGDLEVDSMPVGGLSGLAYDPGCDLFYALTDDRGRFGAPRFYTFRLSEQNGLPLAEFFESTILRDRDGSPFPRRGSFDAEAITLSSDGGLYLATEGAPHQGEPPLVGRFRLDGTMVETFAIPDHYRSPGALHGTFGVRDNHGFESIALTPDESLLFVATENALIQDGPAADLGVGSASRVLAFSVATGEVVGEFVYHVEPVPDVPRPESAFRTNGISDILALDNRRLLILERSFSAGVGNRVRVFLAEIDDATDVRRVPALNEPHVERPVPLKKTLLADLSAMGIDPDNLEGMTFGAMLPDGRRQLVMLSDNNFQPSVQANQVLVFAVSGAPEPMIDTPSLRIPSIQGSGHFSPFVGRCVAGVKGVVTAILGQRGGQAFFVQDPVGDDDRTTSDGVLVTAFEGSLEVAIGDRVVLDGRVEERSWGFELPVTRVVASMVAVTETDQPLPDPVVIGHKGRSIPRGEVASRRLTVFDPDRYAADAFESLEGMLVRVDGGLVVGPTSRHGEFVVVADEGFNSAPWTARGGLRKTPCNVHPHRVVVDDRLVPDPPDLSVGDRLDAPVTGILHYTYGSYKALNTEPIRAVRSLDSGDERTRLVSDDTHLTVATLNLENLWAGSETEKFDRLAAIISTQLGSPDVLAVQEVQDDSGPENNGVVEADETLGRLVEAVRNAGGVDYRWRLVDPADNADGGQPGANIRTAFLYNPDRVGFADRADCGADRAVVVDEGSGLSCSPGLIDPANRAFAQGEDGRGGSRKPLVGEFIFNGRSLVVVNLHLASKGGDDPIFGRRQPRITSTTRRRVSQAEAVGGFVRDVLDRDAEAAVIVLGDLNDFEKSEPLTALETAGLEDLVMRLPPEQRYSFVYLGVSQVLDHILVSSSLAEGAEIEAVHVNSDFPANSRASDHDPIVVRLEIPE